MALVTLLWGFSSHCSYYKAGWCRWGF